MEFSLDPMQLWELPSFKVIVGTVAVTLLLALVGRYRAWVARNALANSGVSVLLWLTTKKF